MRRKIDQLLNGKFEYSVRPPVISAQRIDQTGNGLSPVTGSFTVTAASDKKIRGFMYSSNPRVAFEPEQFYASQVRISYQADLTGLRSGEAAEGSFTLCTDAGEFDLPYCFALPAQPAGGNEDEEDKAISLEKLANLAVTDVHKARSIFVSGAFARKLKKTNSDAYLLWENFHGAELPDGGLEEFLIACHKKDSVEIALSENYVSLEAEQGTQRCSVDLIASCHGYLHVDISADSRFLRVERKSATTDEFVGGRYTLYYVVDANLAHAGMNYGRIRISTCYQTLYLDVALQRGKLQDTASSSRIRRLMRKKMLELYLDLRLKRIEMQSWIDRSMNVITGYRRAGGEDVFADLLQAQLYYADGKKVRGYKIIQDLERQTHRFENAEQYAYYLYISTFFEQDSAYVNQAEARIEQLFLQNRGSWIIQWILLYLKERYLRDENARMEAILIQVRQGCHSPVMYMEACQILAGNPYMLRSLDDVQQRLLLFAARYGMIGEELAFHISNLVLQSPVWSSKIFRILKACYELTGSREVLGAVCACLIAGDRKEKEYFEWYSAGVEQDVRITGLYEYYMETMDLTSIEEMPQIIRMYFAYNNTLGYHKKAAIYRNISDNAQTLPQVFRTHRQNIEHFVISSLSMGRIDDNLAVLYERFLTKRMLTRSAAEQLARLLFAYEITCKNPNMAAVEVVHKNVRPHQEVILKNGRARIYLYAPDACVLIRDAEGRRYASTLLTQRHRYLDSKQLLDWCRELVPSHPALEMYTVCQGWGTVDDGEGMPMDENGPAGSEMAEGSETPAPYTHANQGDAGMTEEDLASWLRVPENPDYREEFRQDVRRKLLDWYTQHPGRGDIYAFLQKADRDAYAKAGKRQLVALLTREGLYEEAFDILERYGAEDVEPAVLVRICSQSVLIREYDEYPFLTHLCMRCFTSGKFDDNILTYLLMYYDGPIEEMKRLWNTGHANDMDTMILEEKILSLMIFTGSGSAGTEGIFASYQSMLGRRGLCQAYLNLKAYEYFVRNLPVADIIFDHLEQMYAGGDEMEDVAKLALLQHYSNSGQLTSDQMDMASDMIMDYNARGMRFAFFKNFSAELTRICQLEDKVFLEYVTDPAHTVRLFYRMRGETEYRSEPMRNLFEGIFVREFILFEEDEAECYTEEYENGKLIRKNASRYLSAEMPEKDDTSRYAQLCQMAAMAGAGDEKALSQAMENYTQTDELTRELFSVRT